MYTRPSISRANGDRSPWKTPASWVGEILAPLLVILGFYARVGALVIVVNMLFAIGLVHMKDVFLPTKTGGWGIELQAFFLFTALSVALIGPGRFAVNRR